MGPCGLGLLPFHLAALLHEGQVCIEVLLRALRLVPAYEELTNVVSCCTSFRMILSKGMLTNGKGSFIGILRTLKLALLLVQ